MGTRRYGRYSFEFARPDKLLYPEDGITKARVADYYEAVAGAILPHLRGRPITMQRFPDGVAEAGFYQKEVPGHFPEWVDRADVRVEAEDGSQSQVVVTNVATLVYLVGQACITPHVWLARRDEPRRPDRMVFDLDPPDDDFGPVRRTARRLRELLDELGLVAWVMTTGSRGAHVWVPVRRGPDVDEVREVAAAVAGRLADRHPEELTTASRKADRGDRLFLDVARNAYAQTAVAPYSLRARPGAPVATPLQWEELADESLDARTWTLDRVIRRLAQRRDPWRMMARHARALGPVRDRLDDD